jgi:hypothetical protein
MPSAQTQALIDSLRVQFGYDDPPARASRQARPRKPIEPPHIYRWARILEPDGHERIVRVHSGGNVDRDDGVRRWEVCCAQTGRRLKVNAEAFVEKLSARSACEQAGFDEIDDAPLDCKDPWWIERRRHPAFIAAFDYAMLHEELPTNGRLVAMVAAKRNDDHSHGGRDHWDRSDVPLSQFASWHVQRPYDEGTGAIAGLKAWVLQEAADDYWWYVRYTPVLKPLTVWRRTWGPHADALQASIASWEKRLGWGPPVAVDEPPAPTPIADLTLPAADLGGLPWAA